MKVIVVLFVMINMTVPAKTLMIAHAGGGIDGIDYSNSIEALDSNYVKGFRYFEIDFSWTSDSQLVCLHDWDKRFKKIFGFKTKKPLDYAAFQNLLTQSTLHPCTPSTLHKWLVAHPDANIITDVKTENIKAIKRLLTNHPNIITQLIPQFYQPQEYEILKQLGFNRLIWILYQYHGTADSVLTQAQNMNVIAVSMRASQAKKRAFQKLIAQGINVFVYTINKQSIKNILVTEYSVSGIYTDFLEVDSP